MGISEQILAELVNATKPISGEQLASSLGVSRNTIWKTINQLRNNGYKICAATKSGYYMSDDNQRISAPEIKKYMSRDCEITIYESLTSTNSTAKLLAEQDNSADKIIIARCQTAGRGRMGRNFYSPENSGIYMSIVLRPKLRPSEMLFITTAAAAAVNVALEKTCGIMTSIKWVNDIFYQNLKVCGILTEAALDLENQTARYAVLGIGLNLYAPKGGFPDELQNIAGGIFNQPPNSQTVSRITASIVDEFYNYYEKLPQKNFLARYRERSMLIGHNATFSQNGSSVTAKVVDIDDDAKLVLQNLDGTIFTLSSGEVSVKREEL